MLPFLLLLQSFVQGLQEGSKFLVWTLYSVITAALHVTCNCVNTLNAFIVDKKSPYRLIELVYRVVCYLHFVPFYVENYCGQFRIKERIGWDRALVNVLHVLIMLRAINFLRLLGHGEFHATVNGRITMDACFFGVMTVLGISLFLIFYTLQFNGPEVETMFAFSLQISTELAGKS